MLRTLVYGKPINACVCLLSFILSVQTVVCSRGDPSLATDFAYLIMAFSFHFPVILPRSFDHP
ncbi:hypothetical protein BDR07DRAFT_1398302, partial [Suillus spraguei]